MTVIVKASNPADLLVMVPALIGFEPRESLVTVLFRGKRTAGAMRFDLPASESKAVHKRIANTCLGMLTRLGGVDSVVPIVYTDAAFDGSRDIPRADFAELVIRRLRHSGFGLRDALCVAADGWASYLDPSRLPGGHPLSEIADSVVADQVPDDWRRVPDIQDLPTRVPDADDSTMKRTAAALALYRSLALLLDEGGLDDKAGLDDNAVLDDGPVLDVERNDRERVVEPLDSMFAPLGPLSDLPLFAEGALEWDAEALDTFGPLLLFAVQGPPARDLVMLQWATSLDVGDAMFEHPRATEVAGFDLGDLMMGKSARPAASRLQRAIEILLVVIARAEDDARRAPLCMLAWSSWALGRASHAAQYVAEVRAIDPDYGMGELLDTMLRAFAVPDWAFDTVGG
ncbi:MAG: hypothetical protein RI885_1088 [Actinomycetota bacterium]